MTDMNVPPAPAQQGQEAGSAVQGAAQQPGAAPPAPPAPAPPQALPPTGLQQQLSGLNQYYEQVQSASAFGQNIGFDPHQMQFQQAQAGGDTALPGTQGGEPGSLGSTNLNSLAKNLAQNWGLPMPAGEIVDENGNMMMTEQQMVEASGGKLTLGQASVYLRRLDQAVANEQSQKSQQQAMSMYETGMGQVQSRGRGSMATLQMGLYQGAAQLYASQDYDVGDYSYFIEQEARDFEREMAKRAEKAQKRQSRAQMVGGIATGIAGIATGNPYLIAQGAGQAAGGAAGGWDW